MGLYHLPTAPSSHLSANSYIGPRPISVPLVVNMFRPKVRRNGSEYKSGGGVLNTASLKFSKPTNGN
jgi:hypothetical protein